MQGVTPALAAMMVMIAFDLMKDDIPGNWIGLAIAVVSLGAMLLKASPVIVLIAAGLAGILLFR